MKSLKEQIRDHEIGCLYLFYGEERYLVRLNTERLKKALMSEEDEMMNLDDLTSPTDFEALRASIETFPFMTEKRLVIIRDSHMFGGKGVASLEKLPELMEEIPSTTTVLFIENEVDKRSKMYKAVTQYGQAEEFKRLDDNALATWIKHEFKLRNLAIGRNEIQYFLSLTGSDMQRIEAEIHKLSSYMGERGVIEKKDIEAIVTPSVEASVFRMTDALGEGHTKEAYQIYLDLVKQGEVLQRILFMIIRQFRILYKASLMENADPVTLSKELGIPSFAVAKTRRQASRFGRERLEMILERLLEMDSRIKIGEITDAEAMDLILMRDAALT